MAVVMTSPKAQGIHAFFRKPASKPKTPEFNPISPVRNDQNEALPSIESNNGELAGGNDIERPRTPENVPSSIVTSRKRKLDIHSPVSEKARTPEPFEDNAQINSSATNPSTSRRKRIKSEDVESTPCDITGTPAVQSVDDIQPRQTVQAVIPVKPKTSDPSSSVADGRSAKENGKRPFFDFMGGLADIS
jgi:hypothetical protein